MQFNSEDGIFALHIKDVTGFEIIKEDSSTAAICEVGEFDFTREAVCKTSAKHVNKMPFHFQFGIFFNWISRVKSFESATL